MSENNGWIKCSERLPDTFTGFDLLVRSSPVLVYGKYTSGEKNKIFGAQIFGNKWYSADGECGEITHWQPFPQPPEEQIMVCEYQYHAFLPGAEPTRESVLHVIIRELFGKYKYSEEISLSNAAEIIVGKNAFEWGLKDGEEVCILIRKKDNPKAIELFKVSVDMSIETTAHRMDY